MIVLAHSSSSLDDLENAIEEQQPIVVNINFSEPIIDVNKAVRSSIVPLNIVNGVDVDT